MQQVAAVEADRLIAPEIAGPEAARRADQEEIAGRRLTKAFILSSSLYHFYQV